MDTHVVKNNGAKKAHNCCNGSTLKGKGVKYVKHYAASVSQQGMKLFLALASHFNYVIVSAADATNAYAQSPAPDDNERKPTTRMEERKHLDEEDK